MKAKPDNALQGGEWVLRRGIKVHTGIAATTRRRARETSDRIAALVAERYAEPTWFADPGLCEPAPDRVNGWQRLREALAEAERSRGWDRGHKWGEIA